jgi:hypothetical protein
VQKADGMGVSITDYLHSLIYPSINQNKKETTVQQESNVEPPNKTSPVIIDEKGLLFDEACKADKMLEIFFKEKKVRFTMDELKKNNFPIDLLLNDESGIITTNFVFEKDCETNEYKLARV